MNKVASMSLKWCLFDKRVYVPTNVESKPTPLTHAHKYTHSHGHHAGDETIKKW